MPNLEPLIGPFVSDPILGYSLLAALFLVIVSVTAGLSRHDLAALAQPRAALACMLCVAVAVLLKQVLVGDAGAAETPRPPLAGFERLPLVLAAMAYGPTPGLVLAVLYSSFAGRGAPPTAQEAILALELALVGWLAIYPSPRLHRWAGPANALVAYALAWATGGLALAQWRLGEYDPGSLLAHNPGLWLGVAASSLALFSFGPAAYRNLFPHSNLEQLDDDHVVIEPLSGRRGERRRQLSRPGVPAALERRRGGRRSG